MRKCKLWFLTFQKESLFFLMPDLVLQAGDLSRCLSYFLIKLLGKASSKGLSIFL